MDQATAKDLFSRRADLGLWVGSLVGLIAGVVGWFYALRLTQESWAYPLFRSPLAPSMLLILIGVLSLWISVAIADLRARRRLVIAVASWVVVGLLGFLFHPLHPLQYLAAICAVSVMVLGALGALIGLMTCTPSLARKAERAELGMSFVRRFRAIFIVGVAFWMILRLGIVADLVTVGIAQRDGERADKYPATGSESLIKAFDGGVEPLVKLEDSAVRRKNPAKTCSVALAISGGGSIAAAYAFGAIRHLAEVDGVLEDLDYISTASGGGVAGLMLLRAYSQCGDMQPLGDSAAQGERTENVKACLDRAWIKSTAGVAFLRKSELALSAFLTNSGDLNARQIHDRLLETWKGTPSRPGEWLGLLTTLDNGDIPLTATYRSKNDRWTGPVFVPNATSATTGERIPLTEDVLDKLSVVDEKRTLAWAVAASMSFPGVGPVRFERKGRSDHIDLIDGGVADNLGFWTAVELVSQDLGQTHEGRTISRGLVLVIDSTMDAEAGLVAQGEGLDANDYVADLGGMGVTGQNPNVRREEELLHRLRPELSFVHLSVRDVLRESNEYAYLHRCYPKLPLLENGLPWAPTLGQSGCVRDWEKQAPLNGVFGQPIPDAGVGDQWPYQEMRKDRLLRTNAALAGRIAFAVGQLGWAAVKEGDVRQALEKCKHASDANQERSRSR